MRVVLVLALLVAGCSSAPDIRLRVEGSGTAERLTYSFAGEDEKTLRNPDVPWERLGTKSGRVSVRLEGVRGTLTCKIIINGRQVRTVTSKEGAAVSCAHAMAD